MHRETHLCYPILRIPEKDRILSVLSHLRDYIIFSSFPFLFMSISNDQVRTCESNPGRKIDVTSGRSIRYANGWSNSTSGGLCIWNLSIDTRISLRANTRWWYVSYRVWIVTELLFKTRARRYTCYQSIQFVNTICADFSISPVTRYHVERSGS